MTHAASSFDPRAEASSYGGSLAFLVRRFIPQQTHQEIELWCTDSNILRRLCTRIFGDVIARPEEYGIRLAVKDIVSAVAYASGRPDR